MIELHRQARNDFAEGGAITLFLAVGYLRWKKKPSDERSYRAPLLLLPLKLERRSASSRFTIRFHEDEQRFNATLLQFLEQDFALMAAHARIGFIQGRLNVSTSWGGGLDLMRLLGPGQALSLLARSTVLGGEEAVAIGLAEAVAPAGEDFDAFVSAFVAPMLRQTPLVLRAFKAHAIAERFGMSRDESRAVERDFFGRNWVTDDHWAAAARALAPAR